MDTLPAGFTQEHVDKALACLAEFEADFLQNVAVNTINPFLRPGVPAKSIGYACDLVKDELTSKGRVQVDIARTRKLLKYLVSQGKIESLGRFRTQLAGSATVECFVLPGFVERVMSARVSASNDP